MANIKRIDLFADMELDYWTGTKHLPREIAGAIKGKTIKTVFDTYPVWVNEKLPVLEREFTMSNRPSLEELASKMLGVLKAFYDEYEPQDGTNGVEILHNWYDLSLEGISIDLDTLEVDMAIGS